MLGTWRFVPLLSIYTDPEQHNAQRYRWRDRQTDRQTDIQTDRQRDNIMMLIVDLTIQQYEQLRMLDNINMSRGQH